MNNRKLAFILILFVIALAFIIIAIGIQVNFLTKDELHIELEPRQVILNTQNNGSVDLNFSVSTNNFWFCDSVCNFELTDLGTSDLISNQVNNMSQEVRKIYSLSFDNLGRGQSLFKFQATCNNLQSFLCRTDQRHFTRNSLVTVNYDLNEYEKKLETKYRTLISKDLANSKYYSSYLEFILKSFNEYSINRIINSSFDFLNEIISINQKHLDLFRSNEFKVLENEYESPRFNILDNDINFYNKLLQDKVKSNNFLIDQFNRIEINLSVYEILVKFEDLNYINFKTSLDNYNELVSQFNNADLNTIEFVEQNFLDSNFDFSYDVEEYIKRTNISFHNNRFNISNDIDYCENIPILLDFYNSTFTFNNLTNSTQLVYNESDYLDLIELEKTCFDVPELEIKTLNKTYFKNPSSFNQKISEEIIDLNPKQCCLNKDCTSCGEPQTPVILLHGHSFEQSSPIESSLNAFIPMQNKFELDEYINAGDLDLSSTIQSGLWSEFENPVAIRVSYYELFYYDADQFTATLRKSEGIENYALRLNELIEIVKQKTGSDKVNIVAHSMGGLVARNYVNLFGGADVDNLITIGTPHFGVGGDVASLCDTFGAEKECEDMEYDSLFLKKLNQRYDFENTHVIYATGCEGGDGIVLEKNAKLTPYKNYEIKGTCEAGLLHNEILNSNEVYGIVQSILSQ